MSLCLTYGFLGFGVAAALLYTPSATQERGLTPEVIAVVRTTAGYQYLQTFLLAAAAVLIGGTIISFLWPIARGSAFGSTRLVLSPALLIGASIPVLIYIYGTGIHTLLHAERYLEHTGPRAAVGIGQSLAPASVLICGYFIFGRTQTPLVRGYALSLALAYELVFLATATRFFALWLPLLIAGGILTSRWTARAKRLWVAGAVVGSIVLLDVPLGLRGLPSHGLVPALHYLLTEPSLVLGGRSPINNVLAGAPLIEYVGHDIPQLPRAFLATSISPVPSHFNNWYEISKSLHLNAYTPFPALGELRNYGLGVFFTVLIGIAAIFALLERLVAKQSGVAAELGNMLLLGAAALVVVESTQYNLRAVTRFVYYAAVAIAGLLIIVWLLEGSKSEVDGASVERHTVNNGQ